MFLFSNKLDLNQETRFTILVYSTGFRITLPALISFQKVTRRDNSQKTQTLATQSYKGENFSNTLWPTKTKIFRLRLRRRFQVAPDSTGKTHGKISLQFRATTMLRNWPVKFRPTRMLP